MFDIAIPPDHRQAASKLYHQASYSEVSVSRVRTHYPLQTSNLEADHAATHSIPHRILNASRPTPYAPSPDSHALLACCERSLCRRLATLVEHPTVASPASLDPHPIHRASLCCGDPCGTSSIRGLGTAQISRRYRETLTSRTSTGLFTGLPRKKANIVAGFTCEYASDRLRLAVTGERRQGLDLSFRG